MQISKKNKRLPRKRGSGRRGKKTHWERGHPARIFCIFHGHLRTGCPRSQQDWAFCSGINIGNRSQNLAYYEQLVACCGKSRDRQHFYFAKMTQSQDCSLKDAKYLGVRRFIAAFSSTRRELIPGGESDNKLSHSQIKASFSLSEQYWTQSLFFPEFTSYRIKITPRERLPILFVNE